MPPLHLNEPTPPTTVVDSFACSYAVFLKICSRLAFRWSPHTYTKTWVNHFCGHSYPLNRLSVFLKIGKCFGN